jgi:hypothetical protein
MHMLLCSELLLVKDTDANNPWFSKESNADTIPN